MSNTTKKKMKKSSKILLSIVLVIVLLIGSVYLSLIGFLGRIDYTTVDEEAENWEVVDDLDSEQEEIPEGFEVVGDEELDLNDTSSIELMSDPDIMNVLLIGSDTRSSSGKGGRSDTMMIISIDKVHGKIKMTSLLRDLYVPIEGRKDNRLNAAYAFGGTKLLIQTIENNFRVKIDKYVRVSFTTFEKVVDKVGGVNIDLSSAEAKIVGTRSGWQKLNGEQALNYARIRKLDSDFGRTNRQRTVIKAIMDKAKDMSVSELISLLYDILPYVKTDFKTNELLALCAQGPTLTSYPIKEFTIPQSGKYRSVYIRKMAVLVVDLPTAARDIQSFIYETQ